MSVVLHRAADGKRRIPMGDRAAIVPSAGNTPQMTISVLSASGRWPVALYREVTNESEQPIGRYSCRWMLHNSVRYCSERRARSGGPEGHKIHGDLEIHDCKIGSAEARR